MNTLELAKEFISDRGFRLLDESDDHVSFKYQMQTFYLWSDETEKNFFIVTLPNFADVTDNNIAHVKELCDNINTNMRQVKLYINNNMILANAELYYLAQEDFNLQMQTALRNLITAKVTYSKMNDDF